MLRAIVLSLALLIGIGTLIPLATEFAEAGSHKQKKYKKKRVKKYSKRWWRAYNKRKKAKRAQAARVRKARAARARKARVLRARKTRAQRARTAKIRRSGASKQRRSVARNRPTEGVLKNETFKAETPNIPTEFKVANNPAPVILPSGNPAPQTWKNQGVSQGELQFRVTNNNGTPIGAASISVVGPAVEDAPLFNNRVKTVGGVATTALRRTVIDQMIKENGWVVNDYQKEIGGRKVYVVVAQSPGTNNQVENRMFYFTEVEGRIYSVATKAPENATERLEEESEKVINSLQRQTPATQVAVNRTVSNLVANEE